MDSDQIEALRQLLELGQRDIADGRNRDSDELIAGLDEEDSRAAADCQANARPYRRS